MAGNSEFSEVSDTELDESHLLSVVKALSKAGVTSRVRNIGRQLKVDHDICKRYPDSGRDRDKALYCVMGGWLRKQFVEKYKNDIPSWRALVVAVKSQVGGNNGAGAKKIADNYQEYMKDDSESTYSEADETLLTTDDSAAVVADLKDVSAYWYQIGVALGLSTNTLDDLEDLGGMIDEWLANGSNQCWRRLLIAIAAPYGGGNPALAKNLLDKHRHKSVVKTDSVAAQPTHLPPTPPASHPQLRDDGGRSDADKFIVYSRNAHKKGDGETPHGLALIISNEKFDPKAKLSERICSPWDDKRLSETLLALGYRVVLRKDQTAAEIEGHFETIRSNKPGELFVKEGDDSFIFCISSHGKWDEMEKADFIYGRDGGKVYLQKLVYEKLNAKECPCLYAKPKLFFVQACRGVEKGRTGNLRADGDTEVEPVGHLPLESDFLFSYATAPKTKAFRRDPDSGFLSDSQPVDIGDKNDGYEYGSLYITELCDAIKRYGFTLDLMNIVLSVHQTLQTDEKYLFEGQFRMCPHLTTSLRGPVFFSDKAEELFKSHMKKYLEEAKK